VRDQPKFWGKKELRAGITRVQRMKFASLGIEQPDGSERINEKTSKEGRVGLPPGRQRDRQWGRVEGANRHDENKNYIQQL